MLEFLLVRVSIWLACVAWFAGSICRLLPASNARQCQGTKRNQKASAAFYAWTWMIGACLLSVHIAASYGFVYHWSHRAAIEATANDSFQTTGVRAGWGVYVNFFFVVIWLCYSLEMLTHGVRHRTVDKFIYFFTAAILASATILFETATIRYLSAMGFLTLIGLHVLVVKAST